MSKVKPALEAAGAKYLSRGGVHKVYEGDWNPRRIVLLEFPSVDAFEAFYFGEIYQNLKSIRDECSSARLVSVEGKVDHFDVVCLKLINLTLVLSQMLWVYIFGKV